MNESIHETLTRVRKPRVHIKYEVYTGDAMELKELPFVVGVMGDFSGDSTAPLKPLSERKFIEIDRDNFNDVMARMKPGLNLKVENTLKGDGSEIGVELKFDSMDDFEPAKIVEKVESLSKLKAARDKLDELMSKADRSEKLEGILEEVLKNTEQRDRLAGDLNIDTTAAQDDGENEPGEGGEK